MFAVDTNILIYAHFQNYCQHEKARRFVKEQLLSGADWCIGWQVYYEYLRITTHPRIHTHPLTLEQAMDDLAPYLESDNCHVLTHTPQHRQIFETVAAGVPTATGNLIHDYHYAALLREHGIRRIYTADADYRRFDFLEVVDPTTPVE